MSKSNFTRLGREQMALLGEAKRLISKEFDQKLALQNPNVINEIGRLSKQSESNRLLEIFNQLQPSSASNSETVARKTNNKTKLAKAKVAKITVKIGDIINDQTCTGFYRGQPVFK